MPIIKEIIKPDSTDSFQSAMPQSGLITLYSIGIAIIIPSIPWGLLMFKRWLIIAVGNTGNNDMTVIIPAAIKKANIPITKLFKIKRSFIFSDSDNLNVLIVNPSDINRGFMFFPFSGKYASI